MLTSMFPAAILCVFIVVPGFDVPGFDVPDTSVYTMVIGTGISVSGSLVDESESVNEFSSSLGTFSSNVSGLALSSLFFFSFNLLLFFNVSLFSFPRLVSSLLCS